MLWMSFVLSPTRKVLQFCLCSDCPTLQCLRWGRILYICQLTENNLPSLFLSYTMVIHLTFLYPLSLF